MAKMTKAQKKRMLIDMHKKSIKLGLQSVISVAQVQSVYKICQAGLRKLGYDSNLLK